LGNVDVNSAGAYIRFLGLRIIGARQEQPQVVVQFAFVRRRPVFYPLQIGVPDTLTVNAEFKELQQEKDQPVKPAGYFSRIIGLPTQGGSELDHHSVRNDASLMQHPPVAGRCANDTCGFSGEADRYVREGGIGPEGAALGYFPGGAPSAI
jgi:hypothetical protein